MSETIEVIGTPGTFECFLDTLAGYLSSAPVFPGQQPDTTVLYWILGDVGMGPMPGLPVAFISPFDDKIVPMGRGGSTGGRHGTDLDEFTVPILIVADEHVYDKATPEQSTVVAGDFFELPGYRQLMKLASNVRTALRVEPTFGGAVATSTISELRPMLIDLDTKVYRGARLTVAARARRSRG
jgi:hypothetical protein